MSTFEQCQRAYDAMLPPDYWEEEFEIEEGKLCIYDDEPCTGCKKCYGDD